MMSNNSIKEFLEFNDTPMYFTLVDGEWWIALKPICEALGVDWKNQNERLQKDTMLGLLYSKQSIVGSHGKERKMICLPEFYVYGWLFQINSDSPLLQEYKWECYRVLYEHFKGTISRRKEVLTERISLDQQIANMEEALKKNEDFVAWKELNKKKGQINRKLRSLDHEIISGVQGQLSFPEN